MPNPWPSTLLFGSLLATLSSYWLLQINATVTTPYLDEFFHIRQALRYNANEWRVWDPKITTPPGLYLVSYLGLWLGRVVPLTLPLLSAGRTAAESRAWAEHLIAQLRAHNVLGILLVFLVTNSLVTSMGKAKRSTSIAHTAFNICLFPPLWFFSGLYYTDVISVLVVLKAHEAFLKQRPAWVTFYSLLSLWFRQTNIFWTAVYLGGAEVVRQVKGLQKGSKGLSVNAGWRDVVRASWSDGVLYDPTVDAAFLEDYLKLSVSLVLSALRNVHLLLVPLIPYIATLVAFAGFILWNGGVVLGDKNNHIASLHLPQMLYIWPYIAFFSWPVVLPSLMNNIISSLPLSISRSLPLKIQPQSPKPTIRFRVLVPLLLLTLVVIHFNTIIHPFTLADNRHYTFYVFRILRRHPITRYILAPAYIFFAWACLGALSSSQGRAQSAVSTTDTRSSTLFLWLITATLSLATAPLVEPRYFILPWIVFRLNVVTEDAVTKETRSKTGSAKRSIATQDQRIALETVIEWARKSSLLTETVWYLLINGITGWIFLTKGFTWPNEPGETMRFMW